MPTPTDPSSTGAKRMSYCAHCGRELDARERGYFNVKLELALCTECAHQLAEDEIDRIEAAALERVRDRSKP